MTVKVGVNIQLEGTDKTGQAFKSAVVSAKQMEDQMKNIKSTWQSTVTAVSTATMALKAVWGPISNFLSAPIKAALDADKAMSRLEKTLKATGQTMGDTTDAAEKYINAMEILTLNEEKAISGVLASNLAYGMNVKQAKLAIEASSALAKITGTDLWGANQLLLQSMNLQLRGIAKIVPEVNKLSESQLRSGQAIMTVIEKLGYLNEMTATTPYLAWERTKIMFEDLQRSLGRAMLSGVDWNKVFDKVEELMVRLGNSINDNKDKISEFGVKIVELGISGLEKFVIVVENVLPRLDTLYTFLKKVGDQVVMLTVPFVQLTLAVIGLMGSLSGNKETYKKMNDMMIIFDKMLKESTNDLLMISETIESFNTATAKIDDNKMTELKNEYVKSSEEMVKAKEGQIKSEKDFDKDMKGIWAGQLSGFKATMADTRKEQNKVIADNKAFFEKLKDAYRGFLDYLVNWAPNFAAALKRAFTMPKAEDIVPKSPIAPSIKGKPGGGIEPYKKLSELGKETKGGVFSEKEFTQDKQLAAEQKRIITAIADLKKANESSIVFARNKALREIDALEAEAYKKKILRATIENDLERAKSEVYYQYNLKKLENEISITEKIGTTAEQRTLAQKKQIVDLLQLQRDRGVKDKTQVIKNEMEMDKLFEMQEKENKERIKGINNELRDLRGEDFYKIEEEYKDHYKKLFDLLKEASEQTVSEESSNSEETIKKYREFAEEFEKTSEAISEKRESQRRQAGVPIIQKFTSDLSGENIDKLNKTARTYTEWLNTAQSGLGTIIERIGSIWGDWGRLIAGIINLLRMSREEFSQLVDGLLDALLEILPRIMDNFPTLVEKMALAIPDIMESILSTLLSVPVWVKFFQRIVLAVGDLLQGLFAKAVFGKSLREEIRKEEAIAAINPPTEPVKFGADIADQGEAKFKIKDVSGKLKAGTLADIQQNLPTVTEKASKNFVQLLIEGWRDFWDLVEKNWRKLWDEMLKLLVNPFYYVEKLWKYLVKEVQKAWDSWNPFNKVNANAMAINLQEILGPVLTELWQSILAELNAFAKNPMKALRGVADSFLQFMRDPFNFLNGMVNKIGEFMTNQFPVLKEISTAFKDFIGDPLGNLMAAGDKLGAFILDKLPFLQPIADKLEEFRNATHNILSGIVDKFQSFIDDKFPILSHVVKALGDFIKDPFQSLKDASASVRGKILEAADYIGTKITAVSTKFWEKVYDVANKLAPEIQKMSDKIKKAGEDAGNAINNAATKIGEQGTEIWNKFKASLDKNVAVLKDVGWKFWTGLSDALTKNFEWLKNIGWKFWDGLVDAFTKNWDWVKGIGKKIFEGFQSVFSIGGGGGGGGGGTLGQIGKALGFSRGGNVPFGYSDKATVAIFSAMGALRAQEGIKRVPGTGISDTVPILARPGERVLTPQQARNQDTGGITLNISINVSAEAKTPNREDLKEMGERIIDYIRRESKNGRNILRPSGVY